MATGAVIYIHGMGGDAAEAEHFAPLFPGYDVIGFDYLSQTPWEAKEEFPAYLKTKLNACKPIILAANSIGAYFSMQAGLDRFIQKAYFISPVVDMESIILGMMRERGVTEAELSEKGTIGDLSWEYLAWVRANPVKWSAPTEILCGGRDHLTPERTMRAFAKEHGDGLSVMAGGEHWFHTEAQMRFLDEWIKNKEAARRAAGRNEDV